MPSVTPEPPLFRRGPAERRLCAAGFDRRSGSAMVEMGVCLPVVLLVVFSAIELADGIFLKQSLAVGAYEAARVVTRPGGIHSAGIARGEEILAARGVSQFQLTISPDVQANTARGTHISVTAEAPLGAFTVGPMQLFSGLRLRHTVHMVRQ